MPTSPGLYARLLGDIKDAMRARDKARLLCLRQVKSKLQESADFSDAPGAAPDDAQVEKSIAGYQKSLKKAIAEMASEGERTRALREAYQAEIEILGGYLPAPFDRTFLDAEVRAIAGELGDKCPRQAAPLVGMLVKRHGRRVDVDLAREAATAWLAERG